MDISKEPGFNTLDRFNKYGATVAVAILNLVGIYGLIDFANVKRILDFGAGCGGPTYALASLVRKTGGCVEAVEKSRSGAESIVAAGILPAQHVHHKDGLVYLREKAQNGEKFDLITAFMLGPDTSGELTGALLAAAQLAAQPNGQLVITSDMLTMYRAKQAIETRGLSYDHIDALPNPDAPLPDIFIVSFSAY